MIRDKKLAEEINTLFPLSPLVKKAIESTNRSLFINNGLKKYAYKIDAIPIGEKQFISSPLTVAKMTEYLQPENADSVLEVGCGSGYQAAVLSQIIRRVFSIERIQTLLLQARESIKSAGIYNINTKLDDGQNGWKEYAPYDRILFSASAEKIPTALFEQLNEGGILLAPIKKGNQQIITRFHRNGNKVTAKELEACEFVPVLQGVE